MQKVIIYIQPQLADGDTGENFVRLDLMEEGLITLNQRIKDAKKIDKIFADFSQTFNLPASKTNNKIFKYFYNPDLEGFDNQILSKAKIELNHFTFKEGFIRLEQVVMRNNRPSIYKVTFFGSTITLNDLIGEDKLSDLTWLLNFDHIRNYDNVQSGLVDGLDFTIDSVVYNDAIIYPLITHTQKYLTDSVSNVNNGGNLSNDLVTNRTRRGIVPEDLKPAILVKNIIKAIEEQYSLTFKTGEFFDSAAMDNLYMWLHRTKGAILLAGTWIGNSDNYVCSGSSCTPFTTPSGLAQPNPKFNLGSGIIEYQTRDTPLIGGAPSFGNNLFRQFTIDFEVTPGASFTSVAYTIELVNATTWTTLVKKINQIGTTSITYVFQDGILVPRGTKIVARVTSEETFQFQAKFDLEHLFNYALNSFPFFGAEVETATFTSNSTTLTPQEGEVIINDHVPDMKVMDFLNTLFKLHNLTAFVNEDDQIVVKTLDDFYNDGDRHDITEYIKTDEHNVSGVVTYDEMEFEYADQKTLLADEFKNINGRKYGSLEYKTQERTRNKYNIKVDLEHMLFERLFDVGAAGDPPTDIQYGFHVDSNLEPIMSKPVLFYGINQNTNFNVSYVDTQRPDERNALCAAGSTVALNKLWIPHNCNSVGSTTIPPTFNLNFGSEINSYDLTDFGGINNSLFEKYYQNYITRLFSKQGRLFKFKAILPLKILINLTLDDTLIIGSRSYTINSMKTKLQSGETDLELINIP